MRTRSDARRTNRPWSQPTVVVDRMISTPTTLPLHLDPFLINDNEDDTAIDRKRRGFFRNITLVASFFSVIWSPDNDVC